MKRKNLWKRASFTIEAACVMPLILLTVIGVLYLCFFVHNRAWLTAAAFESALAGSMDGIREGGKAAETARVRSRELGNTGFFGAENMEVQVSADREVRVVYTADTLSGFGGFSWKLKTEGNSKIIDPVQWIRRVKTAAELLERP